MSATLPFFLELYAVMYFRSIPFIVTELVLHLWSGALTVCIYFVGLTLLSENIALPDS